MLQLTFLRIKSQQTAAAKVSRNKKITKLKVIATATISAYGPRPTGFRFLRVCVRVVVGWRGSSHHEYRCMDIPHTHLDDSILLELLPLLQYEYSWSSS